MSAGRSQTSRQSVAVARLVVVCLAIFSANVVPAFQIGSSTSRGKSFGSRIDVSRVRASSTDSNPSTTEKSVTSGLISQLAVIALKLRLKGQTHVACDVNASSSKVLLQGKVGPVTVKGRGWQSRLGLTCRAIEATVNTCQLDMSRVISNQKLVLTTPAEGTAMVALNDVDFGNFITHPLMQPPGIPDPQYSEQKLIFLKDGATVDPTTNCVNFFGTFLDANWKFTLTRGTNGQQAMVSVSPPPEQQALLEGYDGDDVAERLSAATTKFFNDMVFELDGTFLTFNDMMVTSKGKEPSVMLALEILVRKFPSPGLEF